VLAVAKEPVPTRLHIAPASLFCRFVGYRFPQRARTKPSDQRQAARYCAGTFFAGKTLLNSRRVFRSSGRGTPLQLTAC